MAATEKQAERAVRDLFEWNGWEVRKITVSQYNKDERGLPDLLCTSPCGLQLWIEMKRPPSRVNPRGHIRKSQIETLAEWRRRGVWCTVADGVTPPLQRIAQRKPYPLLECDILMADYDWWPA